MDRAERVLGCAARFPDEGGLRGPRLRSAQRPEAGGCRANRDRDAVESPPGEPGDDSKAVIDPLPDADARADADDVLDAASSDHEDDGGSHWLVGPDPILGPACLGVTFVLVTWYAVHFARLTGEIHRGYGDFGFDLGLYDQGLWLLSRFHAPYVTIMGRNLFGDHTQFLLLALVPLYWIRPDATTLLTVQAVALALGAVPVYMLAMRRLRHPVLATALAAAFLLHPALARTNLENFHPDALLVPVVGFLLYAAVENQPRMFVVFAVLALLAKEDAVLVVLPIAIWFAWRHNRRIGIAIGAAAIAYAAVATEVVIRGLTGVPTLNSWRIPFGGVGGLLRETFTHPGNVVHYVVHGNSPGDNTPNGRLFYVWQMVAPTGLMFLVAPEVAATVALVLASNVLSTFGYQHQIAFHYSMVLLPGLTMGTVYAISRLRTQVLRVGAVVIVGVSALVTAYAWGPLPFAAHPADASWMPKLPTVAEINDVVAHLPHHAVVSAYFSFVPHVDHREAVYQWPTPYYALYWKTFDQEGQPLSQVADVEYLLLPPAPDHADVLASIKDQFVVVARSTAAVLYRRASCVGHAAPCHPGPLRGGA